MNLTLPAAPRGQTSSRSGFRPWLERLEERSQPGSLLTDLAGWSLLGESFDLLTSRQETDDPAARVASPGAEDATVARAATPPESAPRTELRQSENAGVARPAASPSLESAALLAAASLEVPRPTGVAGLQAAAVAARQLGDGGSGIAKFDGNWYTMAPMPSRRQEVSTALLNEEVYVIGGLNPSGQPVNTVEVFIPATNSWRSAAPLPIVNDHNASAVAAGTLYSFGGRSNRTFAYDPGTDSWTEMARMNYQHGGTPAVAVIDEYIYVAGGTGGGMRGNEAEVYDPYTDTWTLIPPMSVPRNHTAGGNIFGYFAVAAGRGSPGSATAFEVYDPQGGKWYTLADLPTGRSGVAGAVIWGCFYVFGGEQPGVFEEVEMFDPTTLEWRQLNPMPTPRHGIFAAAIENYVFLPGGATEQGLGATDINEMFLIE